MQLTSIWLSGYWHLIPSKLFVQFQKNIEDNFKSDRQALIGSDDPQQQQQKIESEDQLADASEDITASLQRTRQIMLQVSPPSS